MAKIVVTGASGKAGRAVVRALLEHEHDVLAVDVVAARRIGCALSAGRPDRVRPDRRVPGRRRTSVVHLAAIPASGIHTEETTFRTNMLSTYNVFEAARLLGLRRVVWASSETILGLPFEREQPAYAPIDEEAPGLSRIELRALEGALGGARPTAPSLDRHAVRRTAILEHHGTARLRPVSVLLERPELCGAGICGATSTRATWPRVAGSHSKPT